MSANTEYFMQITYTISPIPTSDLTVGMHYRQGAMEFSGSYTEGHDPATYTVTFGTSISTYQSSGHTGKIFLYREVDAPGDIKIRFGNAKHPGGNSSTNRTRVDGPGLLGKITYEVA